MEAIPSALSGTGTVTLYTYDWEDQYVGSYTYGYAYAVPDSAVPTISSLTVEAVNSNSVLNGWGIYVYGKSQARITINGAAGAYGSTIKTYSIETDPSIGSSTTSSLLTGILYRTGTINITAKVTDSRGRSATATQSIYIYPYSAPYFTENKAYRCQSNGTRDEVSGTYAYLKSYFTYYSLGGRNSVSANMVLKQVGGSNLVNRTITTGTEYILGSGSLVSDAAYQITITLTDTVGGVTTYTAEIPSAAYIMHIKKGGKAVGFGMAAGEDETVSFGWPVKLSTPLEVTQGGTGGSTPATACAALGAVKKTGDTMTGNLTIQSSLYPSLNLKPTYNSSTKLTVFEGSYLGASSFAAWEDATGNNRRMLEVRTASYESSMDNAVLLRTAVNNNWYSYRMFHAGMATPIPVANGGTGGATPKAALNSLGIFFAETLPASGTDGQICLVPV